jgi:hypothetical protein
MKSINFTAIDSAISIVDNLTDDQLEALFDKNSKEQPDLLDYILSAAVEYENQDLEGLLVYYYCLLMEAYNQAGVQSRMIEISDIESFEEEFLSVLETYFEEENLELLEEYTGQPDLVHFMLVEISTPDDDGTTIEDETGVQLFISMMALISLLAKSNT